MGSFSDDINRFCFKVENKVPALLATSAALAKVSVQEGSVLTNAPGQPVDENNLRPSWELEFQTPTVALISTNVIYAPGIEDGIGPHGPLTLRSAVGGFHSVSQTAQNFDRIVEEANRQLEEGGHAG